MTNRPLLLLLGTGAALGCNFPLGKLVAAQGINPALWAAVISGGAGLIMLLVSRLAEGPSTAAPVLRFSLVSGFISYVVPNFLTFAAIPHLGSGLVAVMFALSPVVTALAVDRPEGTAAQHARPCRHRRGPGGRHRDHRGAQQRPGRGTVGVAAACRTGAGVPRARECLPHPGLAPGSRADRLAALTNLAAVGPLLALAWALDGLDLPALLAVPGLVGLQLLASSLMFLMFFRLQQEGGPTYLSQIGYVAAAVGAGIGVGVLGESYPAGVWAGVAIVAAGIGLTTLAQLRTARA